MTDQELIQALQMCSKVRCPDCLKEHTVCYRRKWMADASTRLETLLAENKQLCWIPVTDGLPTAWQIASDDEHAGEPLEFIVFIDGAKIPTTLYFNGTYFIDDAGYPYHVTHWMPMPEPPKED